MNIIIVANNNVDVEADVKYSQCNNIQLNVLAGCTVNEGMEHFITKRFDLILINTESNGGKCLELIEDIRYKYPNIKTAIVVISAKQNEQLALQCIQAGAQEYLLETEIKLDKLHRIVTQFKHHAKLEQQLSDSAKKVKTLAELDPLTGLINRYFFEVSLKITLNKNNQTRPKMALLIFDLDQFKSINDTYGHEVGDCLLTQVAYRVKRCLRSNELFARLGGDEFGICISRLTNIEQASQVGQRILKAMQRPFDIEGKEILSTVSIGIALFPENAESFEDLLINADIAMDKAKKLGRNQICFFEEQMQINFTLRIVLESEIREALKNHQFRLHYQPMINLETKQVVGFEALIRWSVNGQARHPVEFIPVAEETCQIIEIGRWVFKEAVETLAYWQMLSGKNYTMSINISSVQFQDIYFIDHIEECFKVFNVQPEHIEIELTETAILSDDNQTAYIISRLSALGCRISLDDFGTGFSSISHLQTLPINTIKIDKSLMPDINHTQADTLLLSGLASMVSILGLASIAEGVETEHQEQLCIELGLKVAQGYYYYKPMSKSDIEQQIINPKK